MDRLKNVRVTQEDLDQQKALCLECGRIIAQYVPRGGDGTMLVLRSHSRGQGTGIRCIGSRTEGLGVSEIVEA